jgi:hypothetical protein
MNSDKFFSALSAHGCRDITVRVGEKIKDKAIKFVKFNGVIIPALLNLYQLQCPDRALEPP